MVMSDNLNLSRPVNSSLIGLSEPWEERFWTHELKATKAQIQAAIQAVGSHSAAEVRAHLAKK